MIFGHNSVGSPLSDLAANLDFGPSIVSNYPSPTVRTVDIACDDTVTVHESIREMLIILHHFVQSD